jgi:hypothetical protein
MLIVRVVTVFDNTLILVSPCKLLMNESLQIILSNPPRYEITKDKALARVPLKLGDILSGETLSLWTYSVVRTANADARSCLRLSTLSNPHDLPQKSSTR